MKLIGRARTKASSRPPHQAVWREFVQLCGLSSSSTITYESMDEFLAALLLFENTDEQEEAGTVTNRDLTRAVASLLGDNTICRPR